MKSIIPLLIIPVLAASVLVGCNQNSSNNPGDVQTTNSSLNDTNLSDMNTNMPATNSWHDLNTNMPASTNQ
jgi:hypothetical protein